MKSRPSAAAEGRLFLLIHETVPIRRGAAADPPGKSRLINACTLRHLTWTLLHVFYPHGLLPPTDFRTDYQKNSTGLTSRPISHFPATCIEMLVTVVRRTGRMGMLLAVFLSAAQLVAAGA